MSAESLKRVGTLLLCLGGAVWGVYAVVRYWFGWEVTIRQFLPYHLAAVITGILLKHGYRIYERFSFWKTRGGS